MYIYSQLFLTLVPNNNKEWEKNQSKGIEHLHINFIAIKLSNENRGNSSWYLFGNSFLDIMPKAEASRQKYQVKLYQNKSLSSKANNGMERKFT